MTGLLQIAQRLVGIENGRVAVDLGGKGVLIGENRPAERASYLKELREQRLRKRGLMEILDGLDGRPIVKRRH